MTVELDAFDHAKRVRPDILKKLYVIACQQSECDNEGDDRGKCAYCADITENIVGEFIRLGGIDAKSS